MAASASDLFQLVSNETSTTLASPYTSGGVTVTVASTAGWPTTTGITFAMDAVTIVGTAEVQTAGTLTLYHGVVTNGTTISNVVLATESPNSAQNYAAGSLTRVYMPISAAQHNRMVEGELAHANQDGTLKAGIINNSKLATDAGGIGGAMLAYTAPLTGFSGTPTQTAKFSIHGKFCKVYVDISGTSNAATFSFGIPVLSVNTVATVARVVDATTGFYFGLVQISGYTADVFTSAAGGGFTSSGTKRIINFEFEYETT